MPVTILKPISCRVQDFVNAWLEAQNHPLYLVNPNTKKAITTELLDIPSLGLAVKKDSNLKPPIGFVLPKKSGKKDPLDYEYNLDAVLYIEFNPQSLPKELQKNETEFWLLEIEDEKMLEVIQLLAEGLFNEFNIDIIIKPTKVNDPDPNHLEPKALNSSFPTVMVYCPIIPKEI